MKKLAPLALLSAGLFVITGCSTPSDSAGNATGATTAPVAGNSQAADGQGSVYDFQNAKIASPKNAVPFVATSQPLVVKPSAAMLAAIRPGKVVGVESFEIASKSFPTGMCRVDIKVNYTPGAKDQLLNTWPPYAKSEPSRKPSVGPVEGFSRVVLPYVSSGWTVVDALPSDDALEVKAQAFTTPDFDKATIVDKCADLADDEVKVMFPYTTDLDKDAPVGQGVFAAAKINVLAHPSGGNGPTTSLSVTPGSLDVEVTATGEWKTSDGENPPTGT
ncbi:YgdI/YgdR family lipoprotein [Micrococcus luteus]|nr:YgdI/YgdR family lipoprotein [Micrococcus luteus]